MKGMFLSLLAVILVTAGLALAQTTGEQRYMGDVRFENPVVVNDTLNVTGAVTNDSTLAVTSTSTLTGNVTSSGLHTYGRHTYTAIYASTGMVPTSTYVQMTSSSGLNIALNSTPSISTSAFAIGTYLVLTSTAAGGIIFIDEDTLTDTALELGAATRLVDQYNILELMLTSQGLENKWVEIGFTSN